MTDVRDPKYKKLKNELAIFKRKLMVSERHREQLQDLMEQTRRLLETVSAERLTEEKKKQLEVFSKFVPKDFLEFLKKENPLDIVLGDNIESEMTIMFTDIVSFVSHSEAMSPKENFQFINDYIKRVEPSIRSNRGFVDKYIGDSVMALFYEPDDAIAAAIEIQKELRKYNLIRISQSLRPILTGIGLHTGKLRLGIIGVESRMAGTVISDAVNLASRIESLTRKYSSSLILSSSAFSSKSKEKYRSRFLGKVCVSGKKNAVEIFEILDADDPEIADKKYKAKKNLELGLKYYFDKDFKEAHKEFKEAQRAYPEDKAAEFYLNRSEDYIQNGLPENWDGFEKINEK